MNYYELHQESLHCHQLGEELDDWCQYRYFQNGTGLSCRSPDSWCRRFNVVNVSLKSERSFNGPDLRIIGRDPPILSVSKVLCLRHMIGEIFLRKLVHLDTELFSSIMFELRCTKFTIVQKPIADPFKTPLDASLSQNLGNMIIWLFCSFPISTAMRSPLLNYIILNEGPMYIEWRLGWLHFLSRDTRRCNRRCLRSSMIGILCIPF